MDRLGESFDIKYDDSLDKQAFNENQVLNDLRRELQERDRKLHEELNQVQDLLNHRKIDQDGWNPDSHRSNLILLDSLKNMF